MKNFKLAVASFFLVAIGCSVGQGLPDAPSQARKTLLEKRDRVSVKTVGGWERKKNVWISPLKDPFFWAGTGFFASSVIADVHNVQQCEKNHTCFEANPGADKYKNRVPEIALFTGASYGCSLMLHEYKRWRFLCLALPVTIGIMHWRDATHIYQLRADERIVR